VRNETRQQEKVCVSACVKTLCMYAMYAGKRVIHGVVFVCAGACGVLHAHRRMVCAWRA